MSSEKNYSLVDKALHYLAFLIPGIQRALCDLENDIYKKEIRAYEFTQPVFVTGMPRSGTTLLLELLHNSKQFSTFSYRHMPFILAPLLWKKISKPFSKKAVAVERAHGDGMAVSFDSPEAFEEVIWLNYLKKVFVGKDRLIPLTTKNTTKKFANNYQKILKKLMLESEVDGVQKRYLSKNNANCSRLPLLNKLFPSAIILIPFREPLGHIGSLMKQHKQFSKMHQEDKFSSQYMRWLGHYDFGDNFKPIDFDQWLDKLESAPDYQSENFWLSYWIAAYSNILTHIEPNIHLIDFDKLLAAPEASLSAIATNVKLVEKDEFIGFSSTIRQPTSKPKNEESIDPLLLNRARELYLKLTTAAI